MFRILNTENISRKAVHVVILGVTITYVRWCIGYEKTQQNKQTNTHTHTQICNDKHIDMSLVKHTDEVKLWNALPEEARQLTDFNIFRAFIKGWSGAE